MWLSIKQRFNDLPFTNVYVNLSIQTGGIQLTICNQTRFLIQVSVYYD